MDAAVLEKMLNEQHNDPIQKIKDFSFAEKDRAHRAAKGAFLEKLFTGTTPEFQAAIYPHMKFVGKSTCRVEISLPGHVLFEAEWYRQCREPSLVFDIPKRVWFKDRFGYCKRFYTWPDLLIAAETKNAHLRNK